MNLTWEEEYIKVINSDRLFFHVESRRSLNDILSPYKCPPLFDSGGGSPLHRMDFSSNEMPSDNFWQNPRILFSFYNTVNTICSKNYYDLPIFPYVMGSRLKYSHLRQIKKIYIYEYLIKYKLRVNHELKSPNEISTDIFIQIVPILSLINRVLSLLPIEYSFVYLWPINP